MPACGLPHNAFPVTGNESRLVSFMKSWTSQETCFLSHLDDTETKSLSLSVFSLDFKAQELEATAPFQVHDSERLDNAFFVIV